MIYLEIQHLTKPNRRVRGILTGESEEDIAIYNVAGDIHATSNICTHAYASMVDGFQEGEEIECPLHEGRFNIKTGEALCAPVTDALKVFEVKVEDGDIFVQV